MKLSNLSISTFGTILGIAGIEHGIGEIFQGSTIIKGHFIESWPNSEHYKILAGEPAFSLLLNIPYWLLGFFAILISCSFIYATVFGFKRKYGGLSLLLLNICLLMFGAGMAGPILMGLPIVVMAFLTNTRKAQQGQKSEYMKGKKVSFYIVFFLSLFGWLMMWPGFVILSYLNLLPYNSEILVYSVGGVSFLGFLITMIISFLHDRKVF